jgi:RNA polymerase sigma-70 factor (ECF subfamily)
MGREAAGEADRAWFERLMAENERLVLRTAFRLLGSAEDARDAAQEVFLRLFRHLGRMEDGRDTRPWLYRVTVNVCHDLRRRGGHEELDENRALPGPDPEMAAGTSEAMRHVQAARRRLPEKERAAVVLRDIEGLTTREVAEILGSSEATVRSQIASARLKLRAIVGRKV